MDSENDVATMGHENGSEVDLHEVLCGDCGEPMDTHPCTPAITAAPVMVPTRSTGPRKKASEHPQCPHCGGRVHWNNGAALVNFECMYRQYLLHSREITDPSARLPVFTADKVRHFEMWIADQLEGGDFQYGTMGTAGGATYAAHRPKPERKERKPRAPKTKPIEEVAAEAVNGMDQEDLSPGSYPEQDDVANVTNMDKAKEKREKRAQQRKARKEKLAALNKR